MYVEPLNQDSSLAALAGDWNRLTAGVPFRSWPWLDTWWKHYGAKSSPTTSRRELCLLAVRGNCRELLGLAPWYLEHTFARGRVIRFLGSGEVFSDYLSLLAEPGRALEVATAVAAWLRGPGHATWDAVELCGVAADDVAVGELIAALSRSELGVHVRNDLNCWRINLPSSWEEYLERLSRSHRKHMRCSERRYVDDGRAVLRQATTVTEASQALELLIELHQRSWRARGKPGAYASSRFMAFHRETVPRMFEQGMLQFNWIELDGKPIAAEYQLVGNGVLYAYQGGFDPDHQDAEPGRLSTSAVLRQAIQQGLHAYDLLRGDEPYKAHWRAEPQRMLRVRVVPRHSAARVRNVVWLAEQSARRWVKRGLQLAGSRVPALRQDWHRSRKPLGLGESLN
jgi:CelD/BcsL family acetyltransferase involved in cellulose biosynthesis